MTSTAAGHGKVALITGAGGGIGRAVAVRLSKAGMRLALHFNRNAAGVAQLAHELGEAVHMPVAADLGRPDSVEALIASVMHNFGRIDVLVNNAGVYFEHPPGTTDWDEWQRVWRQTLEVNLMGPANLSFLAARHMARQGGGRIVNVSSRGAFRGEPDAPAYGASKAGLNSMSQSLARALAPLGVGVYAVAPGWVDTDMARPVLDGPDGDAVREQSPLGRVAEPDEIAAVVQFLATENCEYLTGCIIDANGASYLRT